MASRHHDAFGWLEKLRKDLAADVITDARLDQQARQVAEVTSQLVAAPGRAQILRDPVGTGKTAIALTTARLLLDEEKIDYLLIVAPNTTVKEQWQRRSQALFENTELEKAVWRKGSLLVRTHQSHPSRPSPNPARTLVIVDEAHRGLQAETNATFKGLASAAKGAMVLLVTATPYQLTTAGFTTMLTVAGSGSTQEGDALSQYGRAIANVLKHWDPVAGTAAIEDLLVAAEKRRDRAKDFLDRHLLPKTPITVPSMPPVRPTFIPLGSWATAYAAARILPELIGTGKNDAFQRGLTSSSETVFTEQWAVGQHLAELRANASKEITAFIVQLENDLGSGTGHPKVAATVRWVADQVGQGNHVVVFTSWLPTQRALGDAIRAALEPHPEATVTAPGSGQSIPAELRKRFTKPADGHPVVLVLSDRFSESIDLDGGDPSMVHHDLSWNPVRLTQRWGRVVRIRTGFHKVPADRIFVPVLDVEVDRRLAAVVAGRQDLAGLMVPNPPGRAEQAWTLPDAVLARIGANFDVEPASLSRAKSS